MKQLLDKLETALSRIDHLFSIALIDIDFFIRYCIRFSEEQCDEVMNNIIAFFLQVFETEDVFYELGGDEFAIILHNHSNRSTEKRINRTLTRFKKERFLTHLGEGYKHVRMTFSAGIATFPENGSKDILCKKAVTALFLAKSLRRNHVSCYVENTEDHVNRIIFNESLSIKSIIGRWGEIGHTHTPTPVSTCLLWEPQAIAMGGLGNLFIADQNNHQILCYHKGYVIPIAGNGTYGYSGDGSYADKAQLNKPTGLCISDQKLYITDTGNDAVRMVDLITNQISTICGRGQAGYSGDGGLAVYAKLSKPGGIVVDKKNNIYINDIANNVIRKVDTDGMISTFAGNGRFGFSGDGDLASNASFNEIYNIAVDNKGNFLYIVDYLNHRIRKVDLKTNTIETCVGNGLSHDTTDNEDPLLSSLNRPVAVCLDCEGNLYIAEAGNSSIRVVSKKDNKIFTLVGGCGSGTGQSEDIRTYKLTNPNGLAVYDNMLYILDGGNNRICKIKLTFLRGE